MNDIILQIEISCEILFGGQKSILVIKKKKTSEKMLNWMFYKAPCVLKTITTMKFRKSII